MHLSAAPGEAPHAVPQVAAQRVQLGGHGPVGRQLGILLHVLAQPAAVALPTWREAGARCCMVRPPTYAYACGAGPTRSLFPKSPPVQATHLRAQARKAAAGAVAEVFEVVVELGAAGRRKGARGRGGRRKDRNEILSVPCSCRYGWSQGLAAAAGRAGRALTRAGARCAPGAGSCGKSWCCSSAQRHAGAWLSQGRAPSWLGRQGFLNHGVGGQSGTPRGIPPARPPCLSACPGSPFRSTG